MLNLTEKMIEQAREAETFKDVEKTLESMSDEIFVGFLEKLITDVNAMNYHSDGEYIMLQAVLMRAKEVIENEKN
jgi:hypothetical protein